MHETIHIKGARVHNLKNIDLTIPRDKLIVITGLSGSGKSSLAFDTLYAEGQRRYVESLSSYARQFLGQMEKPDVDAIEGLSPAISIDQKTTSRNPRSTVGTVTEIHDYLRLLYANIGTPHCPECGRLIDKQTSDQMIDAVLKHPDGTRLLILAPVVRGRKGEYGKLLEETRRSGFARVRIDGSLYELEEEIKLDKNRKHTIEVVVDRIQLKEGIRGRLADSVETALGLSGGLLLVSTVQDAPAVAPADAAPEQIFSSNFACPDCGVSLEEIAPRMFSFNNPYGACPTCTGLGSLMKMDPDLIVSDRSLSLNQGAIRAGGWNFEDEDSWARTYVDALSRHYRFSLDTPFGQLPERIVDVILYGTKGEKIRIQPPEGSRYRTEEFTTSFEGVVSSLERRYKETTSDDMKVYYEQFMSSNPCPSCHGKRLKKESLAVTVGDLDIIQLSTFQVGASREFLNRMPLTERQAQIGERILKEIDARLGFLVDVGLDYITLERGASTLSGGEAQRIRLATQIGSGLMGVLYILDEPSIGLHQRDNAKLLDTLKRLRDLGNTVLVVEHDEETMHAADYIVDMGPGPGEHGGRVVCAGTVDEILACPDSITGQYLSGRKRIEIPAKRRKPDGRWLIVKGARENNLKGIDAKIPLGVMTAVTGVSGSGKSSLVNEIIYRKLAADLNGARMRAGKHDAFLGIEHLDKVIDIDQSPIGRTPRSNPATYTGLFDLIRELYSHTQDARTRGYKQGRFSFNVRGGRCEACTGDGMNKIEMHFLPDIYVTCEVCKGKRYNRETLEVKYKGKSISDVLDMNVEEALAFFENLPRLRRKLQTLFDVGLGYIRLGQPSTQLSGGEAQRVKLATELSRRSTGSTLYILDEPTTGLHTADVHRLVDILDRLTENGNTVLVIEHNLDVIKSADYLIDLGPEGGDAGGRIVAEGTPEQVAETPGSYTGTYLKRVLHAVPAPESGVAAPVPGPRGRKKKS